MQMNLPIGRNALLQAPPAIALGLLTPHLNPRPLVRGDVLIRAGERVSVVYFPVSGVVSLVVPTAGGIGVESAMIGREGLVGGCLAPEPARAFTDAIVQLPGAALAISRAALAGAAQRSAPIHAMIARFQDLLLAQTQQAAACNALHGVVARTCRWLLQVRQRSDDDMLPLTQEFMAQMLGVQRTTVTLVTRTLQDAGLIKQERGRLIVLDQNGLMNAACECYATMTRQLEEMLPAHEPGAL